MKPEAEEQQRERELQYNALKEEKKKIEYQLFDLLKSSMENKDKLKRIKLIMDEWVMGEILVCFVDHFIHGQNIVMA